MINLNFALGLLSSGMAGFAFMQGWLGTGLMCLTAAVLNGYWAIKSK